MGCWGDVQLDSPLGLPVLVTRVSLSDVDTLLLVVTVVTAESLWGPGDGRVFASLELSSFLGEGADLLYLTDVSGRAGRV